MKPENDTKTPGRKSGRLAMAAKGQSRGPLAFLRGLGLGLTLSAVNFVGMFLTLMLLGGIGEWTGTQFAGIFGLFEIGTGIAFLFCPNVWRMPTIAASDETNQRVELAASAVFHPHWAGGAKSIAGLLMVGFAGYQEGFAWLSAGLVVFAILVAAFTLGLSVLFARFGVAKPQHDVVQFVIRRARRDEVAIPPMSISSAILQIIFGTFTLPAIKLVDPDAFFRPEFAASSTVLLVSAAGTAVVVAAAILAWHDRLRIQARPRQQELTEEPPESVEPPPNAEPANSTGGGH